MIRFQGQAHLSPALAASASGIWSEFQRLLPPFGSLAVDRDGMVLFAVSERVSVAASSLTGSLVLHKRGLIASRNHQDQ
jgi:hypothetical protein